jgi:hypothetical protein
MEIRVVHWVCPSIVSYNQKTDSSKTHSKYISSFWLSPLSYTFGETRLFSTKHISLLFYGFISFMSPSFSGGGGGGAIRLMHEATHLTVLLFCYSAEFAV